MLRDQKHIRVMFNSNSVFLSCKNEVHRRVVLPLNFSDFSFMKQGGCDIGSVQVFRD